MANKWFIIIIIVVIIAVIIIIIIVTISIIISISIIVIIIIIIINYELATRLTINPGSTLLNMLLATVIDEMGARENMAQASFSLTSSDGWHYLGWNRTHHTSDFPLSFFASHWGQEGSTSTRCFSLHMYHAIDYNNQKSQIFIPV